MIKVRTIVFVTHESDIAKFATRNVIFSDGKIQRRIFGERQALCPGDA